MKFIRIVLGKIILLLNFIFTPRGVKRSEEAQQAADAKASDLTLYQFDACPFCVKVRREMKRQSVNVALKDAKGDEAAREELLAGGGRVKVPCLKITQQGTETWMYESKDIVAYLQKEFA
ncbi:glutaredoxin family protein [Vibrio breoganii]|uniref:NrdH-redoxin n=1 Tax=Vibrio breoganii TaxID=553239 RepID=A0AAP8SVF7_9VIBR|nr:glutaredoxin domain-containing protein [Vibrio breoganii]OEF87756.1 NrdH-redoxin [Vibrio breoganii 1C10]PMF91640.1 NrdH-redoxin [Vibrio breoganii]PMH15048.1 NrdH-redoxin [Vibrio breoganii]PMI16289.1 NrdH-redoxin [Vibrio breoganii]PMK18341.1 NrdH-redoxin [Vibrio breoganii]